MSLHTYDFSALKNAVLYGTGKTAGLGSLVTEGDLVHDAISDVCSANNWSWLKRPLSLDFATVTLTSLVRSSNVVTATKTAHGLIVGDAIQVISSVAATNSFNGGFTVASVPTANTFTFAQTGANETASTPGSYLTSFVALPSDFAALHVIRRVGVFNLTSPVAMEELALLRSNPVSSTAMLLYYCIQTQPQASVTAASMRRLEMFPGPTAAETGAIIGSYVRILPKLSGSTDLVDVPADYFPLIKKACMAQGELQVDQRGGTYVQAYQRELQNCIARDGGVQSNLGRMCGPGIGRYLTDNPFAGYPINPPP